MKVVLNLNLAVFKRNLISLQNHQIPRSSSALFHAKTSNKGLTTCWKFGCSFSRATTAPFLAPLLGHKMCVRSNPTSPHSSAPWMANFVMHWQHCQSPTTTTISTVAARHGSRLCCLPAFMCRENYTPETRGGLRGGTPLCTMLLLLLQSGDDFSPLTHLRRIDFSNVRIHCKGPRRRRSRRSRQHKICNARCRHTKIGQNFALLEPTWVRNGQRLCPFCPKTTRSPARATVRIGLFCGKSGLKVQHQQ